jgi:hypothetical protein
MVYYYVKIYQNKEEIMKGRSISEKRVAFEDAVRDIVFYDGPASARAIEAADKELGHLLNDPVYKQHPDALHEYLNNLYYHMFNDGDDASSGDRQEYLEGVINRLFRVEVSYDPEAFGRMRAHAPGKQARPAPEPNC